MPSWHSTSPQLTTAMNPVSVALSRIYLFYFTTCSFYYYYYCYYFTLGNHDPEGGLKIRKIYKKLGMSSNPCSHDLANCHAKEPR